MDRRTVLYTVGTVGGCCLAGCLTRDTDDAPEEEAEEENDDEGELRVVVDESFVRPEDSPGRWLKSTFEEEYEDAEIVWVSPEAGIDLYVQQAQQDDPIGEDVYLGLTPTDLVRVDTSVLDDGTTANVPERTNETNDDTEADDTNDENGEREVFRRLDGEQLSRSDRLREEFLFDDPGGRALPYTVDFGCLLYDGIETIAPGSLDELLDPPYDDRLLVPNPTTDETGRAFAYWTVDAYGEDESIAYWDGLREAGVQLFDDRESSHEAYTAGDDLLAVARATDRIDIVDDERESVRHQVSYPDDEGYLLPRGAAVFEDTTRPDLAYQFLDFLLSTAVQAELVSRTTRFPVVDVEDRSLPDRFLEYATEPSTPVSLSYDALRTVHDGWFDEWESVMSDPR